MDYVDDNLEDGDLIVPLDVSADLEAVLTAWHDATLRLERTHEALRAEVVRLTAELETKNRQLAHQRRLADLGQMASHVAHEVRNSLVPVTLYLSLLRRRLSDDVGSRDILGKIETSMTALDATVHDLLHFTADRDPCYGLFVLRDLVDELCASLAPQLAAQSIAASVNVSADIVIDADRNMVRRALLNLTLNSVDVMPQGGTLSFTSSWSDAGVAIEVADSGPGFSDESQRRAFEPFFSTKSGGTGLGLAIVERVAEMHGGQVSAENCSEGGAAVTLFLPQQRRERYAA